MKIKIEQLDEHTRKRVIFALQRYAKNLRLEQTEVRWECIKLIAAIRRSELLLCEYINTDAEKGGNHGL